MKNPFKIMTFVLGAVWIIVIFKAAAVTSSKNTELTATESKIADTHIKATKEPADMKPYSSTLERLKSPYVVSRYQDLLTRNIFVKPQAPPIVFTPDDLRIVSIEPVNLPFIYIGFIQTASGTIIGQVNWSGKTYFVERSEKLKDYKVVDVDKRIMKLEGGDGRLTLELKKPVKGKELVAKLYNSMDDKTYEVRKDDTLKGYKILDIKADNVILYGQNKEWVVNEGR